MQAPTPPLVVLFADITGSTRLYDTLGNDVAKALVARCIGVMSRVTEENGGRVIKTIGDELMCTFPEPGRAARAAGEMHTGVRNEFNSGGDPVDSMHITVGLHLGPVIEEEGDVFGDTVNVASRMVKLAKPDQIITSRQTVDALPAEYRASTRFYDQATLKGKLEAFDVYELIWEVSGLTMVADAARPAPGVTHTRLELQHRDRTYQLTPEDPPLTLGRSDKNDVVVKNALASREHARVEYHRGRFVLYDQSVNGTHVSGDKVGKARLRRDKIILDGSGAISLGEPAHESPEQVVFFTCR